MSATVTPQAELARQLNVEPRRDSEISLDLFGVSDLIPRPSFTWNDVNMLGGDLLPATSPLDPNKGLQTNLPGYLNFPSFTMPASPPVFASPPDQQPQQPTGMQILQHQPTPSQTAASQPQVEVAQPQEVPQAVPAKEKPKPPSRSRERNREAQARYRAKRRAELAHAKASFEKLNAELMTAKKENRLLTCRSVLYEQLLAAREDYLNLIRSPNKGTPFPAWGNKEGDPPPLYYSWTEPDLPPGQAACLDGLCRYLDMIDPPALPPAEVAMFQETPLGTLCRLYRDTRAEILHILDVMHVSQSAVARDAAVEQLISAMKRARSLLWRCSRYRPGIVTRVVAGNPQHAEAAVPSEEAHWAAVIEAMMLTPAQSQAIFETRAALIQRMDKILHDRQVLLAEIEGLSVPDKDMSSEDLQHWQKATLGVGRSLDEEKVAHRDAYMASMAHNLSLRQKCIMLAMAFPYLPDMLRIFEFNERLRAANPMALAQAQPVLTYPKLT